MDPMTILQVVGCHRVLVGGMLFTLFTDVHLAEALQADSLEGSKRKCKVRDVAGDGRSPRAAPPGAESFQRGQQWPQRGWLEGAPPAMSPSPPLGPLTLWQWGHDRLWRGAQRRGSPSALQSKGRGPRRGRNELNAFMDPGRYEVH